MIAELREIRYMTDKALMQETDEDRVSILRQIQKMVNDLVIVEEVISDLTLQTQEEVRGIQADVAMKKRLPAFG